jgi:transposase
MHKSAREVIIFHHKQRLSPGKIVKLTGLPRSSVYNTIARYKELGTSLDRSRSGRPTVLSSQKVKQRVKKLFKRNLQRSCRKVAKKMGISRETLRRYLKQKLKLKPFKK